MTAVMDHCCVCQAPVSGLRWGRFDVCSEAHYTHVDQHMGRTPGLADEAWCSWCRLRHTQARMAREKGTHTTLFAKRK